MAFEAFDAFDAREPGEGHDRAGAVLRTVVSLCAYILMIFWTFQGFYDAAAVGPLVLSARLLQERRGLAAGVAYAVGAVIHFRAMFLAPWAIAAAWTFFADKQWRTMRAKDVAALLAGAIAATGSLTAFALVSPTLGRQDVNNPVNVTVPSPHLGAIAIFAAVVALAAALIVRARARLDLAMLAWLTFMVLVVKEAHEWHIVVLLAWLVAPVTSGRPRGEAMVLCGRLAMLGYTAFGVMIN
jgi:hypothetical protein